MMEETKKKINEDGDAGAMATLDATPGMGVPQYASRGTEGSGDIPSGTSKKKRKKKKGKKLNKIKSFWDFQQQ